MARIGYARVSSLDQDLDSQLARLASEGCTIVRSEKVSGGSREGRPELATVLQFLQSGDELVVTRLDRLGRDTRDVLNVIHECEQALLIAVTLVTSLTPTIILLPLLGIVLNGTSSVLYGTVPELSGDDKGRAFAIFYTSVLGAGGIAPILYGTIADHSSRMIGVLASAATAVLIVPLVLTLRPFLRASSPR